ncbi:MAG: methyltransferase [Clostridia bacterium]|nr:methyltransferase [Clostridia bacterium]
MEKRLDKINESVSLYQYTEGFSYGTDAVLVSAFCRVKKGQVGAELGTGTGIIPTLLCHHKNPSKIFAFEIQEDYVALARENAELNGFSDRIEVIHENVRDITPSYLRPYGVEAVDFVVSNPPYMKQTSGALGLSDRKMVARHEMHSDISDFARAGANLLKNGGDMYIVYRPDRLCDLICALRENSLEPKEMIFVKSFEGTEPCLVLVRAKKCAESSLKLSELIIYREKDVYTEEMERVYQSSVIGEGYGKRN